jgi:hypothetical protein
LKCNRTACTREAHPGLIHRENRKTYCPKCARTIERYNKGRTFDFEAARHPMASTTITGHLSFGYGELDDNGFWESGDPEAARENEREHPMFGACWPFETPEDVSRPGAEELSAMFRPVVLRKSFKITRFRDRRQWVVRTWVLDRSPDWAVKQFIMRSVGGGAVTFRHGRRITVVRMEEWHSPEAMFGVV